MRTIDQRWADLIADPAEREQWRQHFGRNVTRAEGLYGHFTDPADAAQWADSEYTGRIAAYLHKHGIPDDTDRVFGALNDGDEEDAEQPSGKGSLRGCLILAHPHLTREDRDALAASGLTVAEIDHLIATGTYHRDTVALMAGLH